MYVQDRTPGSGQITNQNKPGHQAETDLEAQVPGRVQGPAGAVVSTCRASSRPRLFLSSIKQTSLLTSRSPHAYRLLTRMFPRLFNTTSKCTRHPPSKTPLPSLSPLPENGITIQLGRQMRLLKIVPPPSCPSPFMFHWSQMYYFRSIPAFTALGQVLIISHNQGSSLLIGLLPPRIPFQTIPPPATRISSLKLQSDHVISPIL